MIRLTFAALLAALLLAGAVGPAGAWDESDSHAAISAASARYGVSWTLLDCLAYWESDGTYNAKSRGDYSRRRDRYESRGLAQIHDRGLYPDFIAWGYTDRDDPYQSMAFVARWIAAYGYGPSGAGQWSVVGVFC